MKESCGSSGTPFPRNASGCEALTESEFWPTKRDTPAGAKLRLGCFF